MKRLVYSPYVQAFVKTDDGVVDLSPYIVRGSVNRKVNQVSTAQLTLRNPVVGETSRLLFTEYMKDSSDTPHPLIHPMDPITIIMQRLQGAPVQVFTGYCDRSPYLQLYPGLCTIEASCTLKRLLHTQWDASLLSTTQFLAQFGWLPTGGGIVNPTYYSNSGLNIDAGKIQGRFNDGSIGALLFAILNVVGQWDEATIWIEALPPQLKDIVSALYTQISQEVQQTQSSYKDLLTQILGTASQGSGGPSTGGAASGPVAGAKQIVQKVSPIASQYSVPLQMVLAVMFIETGFHNQDTPGNPHYGWFQAQTANPPYAYGTWSHTAPTVAQAHDLGLAGTAFCSAAAGWAQADPSLKSDIQQWAMKVQGVTGSNNPYYISGWADATATAAAYISQFGSPKPGDASPATSTSPSASASQAQTGPTTAVGGKSPGGKTGKSANPSGGSYLATIFPTGTAILVERTDMGVDFSIPNGTGIGALGDGTVSLTTSNGFQGQPLLMVTLDTPINGYTAWYVAEGIRPVKTSGRVSAGEQIAVAESHNTGIETGWADPKTGYPVADSYYTEGMQTPDGENFANVIGVPVLATNQTKPMTVSGTATSGSGPAAGGGTTFTGGSTNAAAAAFAAMLNLPSIFTTAEAMYFTGKRSFIADQPLFPFIDQLCRASMRNFMSMPNGNFLAFFPDYFGFFGRQFYWEVRDIEILDGRIDLNDDAVLTHLAVAGDTLAQGSVTLQDLFLTGGIFDIFDAYATGYVGRLRDPAAPISATDFDASRGKTEALAFLQRYGARTFVEEVPAIRSPFYELFLAFQNFMIAWSNQYATTFELTFMPELFPGGLVGLPDHHLQLYVQEVVHYFDYEQGFTTNATFSSPSQYPGDKTLKNVTQGNARPLTLTQKSIQALNKGKTKQLNQRGQ